MKSLAGALGLTLLGLQAQAASDEPLALLQAELATPTQALQQAQVVRGRFTQTKTLSGFEQPLVSSGQFLQVRDHGVVWKTLAPIQSQMILRPVEASAADNDAVAQVLSNIFLGLFELDLEQLAQDFELSLLAPAANEAWALSLTPRNSSLNEVVQRLRIGGRQTLERVAFSDALGDTTMIELQEIELSAQPPEVETLSVFGP